MKYRINEKILKNYYNDLLLLEDWIPAMVRQSLPNDIFFELGKKIKHKRRYTKKLINHRIENTNSNLNFEEMLDHEVEVFISKYPHFKPLFIKN